MWKTLSKNNAAKETASWKTDHIPVPHFENDMAPLREKLVEADSNTVNFLNENQSEIKNRKDYFYDLKFGLELYHILNEEYNFSERNASDDEVWIYLSIRVVPDLVYKRWGLTESRFYKQSRRIWLRTLWWYIHLSWAGSKEETYNRLKSFTTDEVVQLVERSGPRGYRIDLTREIMKQFSFAYENSDRLLFRRIMKVNTARLKVIEPSLALGGLAQYVKELIDYFDYTNGDTNKEPEIKYTTSS
ncbi:hypothetical protein F9U64_22380 [Gracilibacillus oryzae]|uniref:Uncharacterized protein n=1 Tax=Gracilibacillus oryzae TaxID=1672701 RepID=A0A7C8GPZ2_9BACI|nr:DUF6339 family protein [Gracilibacillus oryzae]KAB8125583.1 hypothetical protein F9U64_22380 [Gracilibacillus oryzae]